MTSPAGRGGVYVALSSSNAAAATVPVSVGITEGNTRGTFPINTDIITTEAAVTITAQSADSRTATLRVMPRTPALRALEVEPSVLTGGNSVRVTVRLDIFISTPTTVTLTSDDRTLLPPASVEVAPFQTSATFTMSTRSVDAQVVPRLTASAGGQSRTVAITLIPRGGTFPTPALNTFVNLFSLPGDYIGQGRTMRFTPGNASISARAACGGRRFSARIELPDGNSWFIDIEAPPGQILRPGPYENATGTRMGNGVVSVRGEGRSCTVSYGRFDIGQVDFGPGDEVRRFHALIEQRCNQSNAQPLAGEISLEAVPFYNVQAPC